MKQQLFLNLPHNNSYDIENFIVSSCNYDAYKIIDNWGKPSKYLGAIIYGNTASGKTHLLKIWQKKLNADILDSDILIDSKIIAKYQNKKNIYIAIDDIDEIVADKDKATAVFHLFNIVKSNGGNLFFTANKNIDDWCCPIPDLTSRLKTLFAVKISQPDEELLFQLLVKFFSDRQVKISLEVISYLVKRTERSFAAIFKLVNQLDSEALSQKRPVTIPLARNIIQKLQENS